MPRPKRCRRICQEPEYGTFAPEGIAGDAAVFLTLDEYEVIRLVDREKQTHEQCAAQMDISRTTVTEIYESAREKIARCIIDGCRLVIGGGNYRLCDGSARPCRGGKCYKDWIKAAQAAYIAKGENVMRIAVTYENGQVFQHFGHTEQFKIYDVADGKVVSSQVVDTIGSGHGALAGFLAAQQADALICGGIGGGAQMALAEAGIRLYAGIRGSADEAVAALLEGTLSYDPEANCDHHGHEHGSACGEHGCEHSCH
ncbi:MAG: DUF134 domain-containing protein [Firmicutes bacterium]|nr:DUF134 domain-containing protein [Bacillota bacterium]